MMTMTASTPTLAKVGVTATVRDVGCHEKLEPQQDGPPKPLTVRPVGPWTPFITREIAKKGQR